MKATKEPDYLLFIDDERDKKIAVLQKAFEGFCLLWPQVSDEVKADTYELIGNIEKNFDRMTPESLRIRLVRAYKAMRKSIKDDG